MGGRIDINDCIAIIDVMASITIRNLDPDVKERLRVRAARAGWSMEEEARVVLRAAVADPDVAPSQLADSIGRRFKGLGVELQLPDREAVRRPPKLS